MKTGKRKITPTDFLLAAADCIYTNGLAKGGYKRNGSYCVLGALDEAFGKSAPHVVVVESMSIFEKHIGTEFVARWNDSPDITKNEVIAALHDAARGVK